MIYEAHDHPRLAAFRSAIPVETGASPRGSAVYHVAGEKK